MMKATTQRTEILKALRRGERLTAAGALRMCGCFRLAARIHDLRRAGFSINTRRHPAGYAVYWLHADGQ